MIQGRKENILERLRERKGDEWIEENREFLIRQARQVGIDISEDI